MNQPLGFTLVELMLVIVILSILVGIGSDLLQGAMNRNSISAASSRFTSTLAYARSEAIANNQRVILASDNGGDWSEGWSLYLDSDNDSALDTSADQLLKRVDSPAGKLAMNSVDDVATVILEARGRLLGLNSFSLSICNASNTAENVGRLIEVNRVGRVSVAAISNPSSGCL